MQVLVGGRFDPEPRANNNQNRRQTASFHVHHARSASVCQEPDALWNSATLSIAFTASSAAPIIGGCGARPAKRDGRSRLQIRMMNRRNFRPRRLLRGPVLARCSPGSMRQWGNSRPSVFRWVAAQRRVNAGVNGADRASSCGAAMTCPTRWRSQGSSDHENLAPRNLESAAQLGLVAHPYRRRIDRARRALPRKSSRQCDRRSAPP